MEDQADGERVGWSHDPTVVAAACDSMLAHRAWNAIAPSELNFPVQLSSGQHAAYRHMLDADETYAHAKLVAIATTFGRAPTRFR